MDKTIAIMGEGGQGVKLLGQVLSEILHDKGNFVSYVVKYDAAVRGGEIIAEISVSKDKIDNPILENPDLMLKLSKNEADMTAVYKVCQEGAPTQCDESIDFISKTSKAVGSVRFINMVTLGWILKYIEKEDKIKINDIDFSNYLPKNFFDKNLKAIEVGKEIFK